MDKLEFTVTFNLNDITLDMFLDWLDDYIEYQINPDLKRCTINGIRYSIRWDEPASQPSSPYLRNVIGIPRRSNARPLGVLLPTLIVPDDDVIHNLITIRALKRSRDEVRVIISSAYTSTLDRLFKNLENAAVHFFPLAKITSTPAQTKQKQSKPNYGIPRDELVVRLAKAQLAEDLHANSDMPYKAIVREIHFDYGGSLASSVALLNKMRRKLRELEKDDPDNFLPDVCAERKKIAQTD